MKWHVAKRPEVGDRRVRTVFAWLPIYIRESRKEVWLKWITVEERFEWAGVTEPRLVWRAIREATSMEDEATHIINNPDDYI